MDSPLLSIIIDSYIYLSLWLVGFFVTFTILAKFMACNPQPSWRHDIWTDIIYYFVMPLLTRFVHIALVSGGVYLIHYGVPDSTIAEYVRHGYGYLGELPVWLQAAIIFLASDIILYWTHRWFHTAKMWKFHAIHHSPPHVDWLSTYRFHPINTWLSFTLVDSMMLVIGFSPEAVGLMAGVNMIYSAMVHANLNWTFGPFRYVFASPVFHRWHHTAQEEGMDKNFAPTFPLIDIVFGTFYMPEGRRPEIFGVPGSDIPSGFIGQMIWPFRQRH